MSGVGSLDTSLSTFSTFDCFRTELFSWGCSPSFCSVSTSALDLSDCFGYMTITGGGGGGGGGGEFGAATCLPLLRVIALQCSFPSLLGFTSEVLCSEP